VSKVKLLAGETQKSESNKAIQACNDYLRMGVGRSLAELSRIYTAQHHEAPPTQSWDTLKAWSCKYNWSNRAGQWDSNTDERKTLEYNLAMKNGLALDYERVNSLKGLALFLESQVYEQGETGKYHNVWLPDVKSVGYGENSEIVDIERFNAGLIQQFRGTLDDLAKETGGRIAKSELGGIGGGPIQIEDVNETRQRLLESIQKSVARDDARTEDGVG